MWPDLAEFEDSEDSESPQNQGNCAHLFTGFIGNSFLSENPNDQVKDAQDYYEEVKHVRLVSEVRNTPHRYQFDYHFRHKNGTKAKICQFNDRLEVWIDRVRV